jgi:hypothetical protein
MVKSAINAEHGKISIEGPDVALSVESQSGIPEEAGNK